HVQYLAHLLAVGWECEPLGVPQQVGPDVVGALSISITPATLQLFREKRGSALRRSRHEDQSHDWAKDLLTDGYCIIRDLVPKALVGALHDDLSSRFQKTPFCKGDFYGAHTKRFGGLLKRSRHAAAFVQHPVVLE